MINAQILAAVDAIRWRGPRPDFEPLCERLGSKSLSRRASALAQERHRL
jgi:hypothetical protein